VKVPALGEGSLAEMHNFHYRGSHRFRFDPRRYCWTFAKLGPPVLKTAVTAHLDATGARIRLLAGQDTLLPEIPLDLRGSGGHVGERGRETAGGEGGCTVSGLELGRPAGSSRESVPGSQRGKCL
jgi:hypothetical protein